MATLNISISVPDSQVTRLLDGFAANTGYQATIINPESIAEFIARGGNSGDYTPRIPNPTSKAAWVKISVINYIISAIQSTEIAEAERAIRKTVLDDIKQNIVLS